MSEFNNKVLTATKWSVFTELAAKLVTPITSIVLARLLTPEAFGVVATLAMIISFAEIFTDAGFQKYLIQHEFEDSNDKEEATNVAFWSNFILSLIIWGSIATFSGKLARIVGCPGMGNVLTIACISIPLESFSCIQMALFKRKLDFKTLFKTRMAGICIPIFITVPLAIIFRNYWALVVGTIAKDFTNAVILTIYSDWKPKLFYSFSKLKEMISFTIWSLVEAVSIWFTNYVDIFLIGIYLNEYFLGLYKTAMTTVGQIIGIISATTTPVLFSTLSRLQNDEQEFQKMFYRFQKIIGIILIPLGTGIFCYKGLITSILLGSQWSEAAGFIGLWGLTSVITIVLSCFNGEVYRSKGRPKISVLDQFLHLIVLIPAVYIAVGHGFKALYVTRSLVRFEAILVGFALMHFLMGFSVRKIMRNVLPCFIASATMCAAALLLHKVSDAIWFQFLSIGICILVYFSIIYLFPEEKGIIKEHIIPEIRNKLTRKNEQASIRQID